MLIMKDMSDWLDHADPWSHREAEDLLNAVLHGAPAGVFDCATSADGHRWIVMAAHAEAALVLSELEMIDFAELVRRRYGLADGQPATAWWAHTEDAVARAANDSRPMPLWDAPLQAAG